jgi:5'-methylthioadenosine phosphorylase
MRTLGIIGGSGLYELEGLQDVKRTRLETPFGSPSDEYVSGRLHDTHLVFLPRHGRGHRIPPHQINYRANIHGMKQLGAEWIVSVSAVGSMREDVKPGDVVVIDQFIDRTKTRVSTFLSDGITGHASFSDPICGTLAQAVAAAGDKTGARVHRGGTYLCIEGPQFSTRAESLLYRQWNLHVIGMTNLTEAKLAREAEICYSTIAMATDYDCWHQGEDAVTLEAVMTQMAKNSSTAKSMIRAVADLLPSPRACGCKDAMKNAIVTDRAAITAEARQRLSLLYGKYL